MNLEYNFNFFKKFNKGFYKNGKLILDRKEIATNYLKGQFFNDVIGISVMIFSHFHTLDTEGEDNNFRILIVFIEWLFFVKMYTLFIIGQRLVN